MSNPPETETWYAYRNGFKTPVLKATETSLEIMQVSDLFWRARFEMSNPAADLVEVEMSADTTRGPWRNSAGERFAFRLDRIAPDVLIGQVYDSNLLTQGIDSFVAVKSRRTSPLPVQESYTFGCSHIVPLDRSQFSEAGTDAVVVDLNELKSEIIFNGDSYKLREPTPYAGGLKVTGFHSEKGKHEGTLWLWILPVDPTGRLFATGYLTYYMIEAESTAPFSPQCNWVIHLCQ